MGGISYSLPIERFERIVDDGAINLRKRGASDEEISDFVSSCWERNSAGEFSINITFTVDKKDFGMCCTGACLYEDYTGECTIGNGYFPEDAWCQLPSEETEYEERENDE